MSQASLVSFLVLLVEILTFPSLAGGFVRFTIGDSPVYWPTGQAVMSLRLGCPAAQLRHWGPCWDDAAADALLRWNEVAQRFRFVRQTPTLTTDVCANDKRADRVNTAGFATTVCGMQFGGSTLAVTIITGSLSSPGALVDADTLFNATLPWSTYPGPLRRNQFGEVNEFDFHRVAVHEFGHSLGLAHPDDSGQQVSAIMNSSISSVYGLQYDDINGVNAIYPSTAPPANVYLENPAPGDFVSGISVVSGWACDANRIEVQLDDRPLQLAAYGTQRTDTIPVCGDDNNGFSLLINWNDLGDGSHSLVALRDGVAFDRRTFFVSTLGTEFLRGATGAYQLFNFNGRTVVIEWKESLQNFVIIDVQ